MIGCPALYAGPFFRKEDDVAAYNAYHTAVFSIISKGMVKTILLAGYGHLHLQIVPRVNIVVRKIRYIHFLSKIR